MWTLKRRSGSSEEVLKAENARLTKEVEVLKAENEKLREANLKAGGEMLAGDGERTLDTYRQKMREVRSPSPNRSARPAAHHTQTFLREVG